MKLAFGAATEAEPGRTYPAPWTASAGTAVSVPVDTDSLRLVVSWLGPGDWLAWPARHGEEAVYVLEGAAHVDARVVPAGGAIVLGPDEPCRVEAPAGARLAHFSSGVVAASAAIGPVLVGPGGRYRSGSPGGSQAIWYADPSDGSGELTLLKVSRDTPGNRGRAHTHSADEILFLVEGGIRLGAHEVPTGHAVFIPANTRYAVTSGDGSHAFLNYRAAASTQRYEGDVEDMVETALGRGGSVVEDLIT